MISIDGNADVIDKYMEWLSADFEAVPSDDGIFLVTPFYRPDREGIELEVEVLSDGRFRISDMGDTVGYLFVNGLTLSRTMVERAKRICTGYGVSFEGSVISVEAEPNSIGEKLHWLIQTVLAVTDLIQMRRSTNPQMRPNKEKSDNEKFDNEVESLIVHSGVICNPEYEIRGKLEKHRFKFHVNSWRNMLVQPITATEESTARAWAERWAYRFNDVIQINNDWRPIAVLDDRSTSEIWTPKSMKPISEHTIIKWSDKDELPALLVGDAS